MKASEIRKLQECKQQTIIQKEDEQYREIIEKITVLVANADTNTLYYHKYVSDRLKDRLIADGYSITRYSGLAKIKW